MTHKSDSHMTAVCTTFSNCRSFQTPSYDTSPILSSIKTSPAPNQSEELDPFESSPPLLLIPTQRNWKFTLVMLWSMHISNFAAQLQLASEEFMQNDTIYYPILREKMVLPPIGINFVEVVRGCQRAYVFIICGQLP